MTVGTNPFRNLSRQSFSDFKEIAVDDDWFKVHEVVPGLYAISEPRHYEATLISLLVGDGAAVLVDTGCGIGNLRRVVERITAKPVTVINTHTHLDHLGSNRQFDDIVMFDHPRCRHFSEFGASRQALDRELLADNLIDGPLPKGFKPEDCGIPPFKVARWVKNGECIKLGGKSLIVIHTPGEAPEQISLLGIEDRVLFSGDILLDGPIWTHLEGGSFADLVASFRKLLAYYDEFDRIMPGHNVPWIEKTTCRQPLPQPSK